MKSCPKFLAAVIFTASLPWLAVPASAGPLSGPLALNDAAAATALPLDTVQFRRWGPAAAGAVIGGAIIGGAIAATRPWGYDYGYRYDPAYDYGYRSDPGYDYNNRYNQPYGYRGRPGYDYGYAEPGYTRNYATPGSGMAATDDVTYCQQRFRSYDPATGTYLGYDGRRHPCP